jgi:hypothetical protein
MRARLCVRAHMCVGARAHACVRLCVVKSSADAPANFDVSGVPFIRMYLHEYVFDCMSARARMCVREIVYALKLPDWQIFTQIHEYREYI